jgi:NADH-quinone oxidoreductase subunit N
MTPVRYLDLLRLTLPEIAVTAGAFAALTLDLVAMRAAALRLRWAVGALIACAGCVAAILLLWVYPQQGSFGDGMLIANSLTRLVQAALLVLAILTVLLSTGSTFTSHIGEYLAIILFATTGMMFLSGSQNLLVIFISLELLSLSLYILAAFNKRSRQSAEGALKYFLFGGMSAAFLLFGISLLYGLTGSINLVEINRAIETQSLSPLLAIAMVMTITGFGFKVAAVPFHLWAPDAYQGAPTPSGAFIASSSKVASFFVFAQVMLLGLAAGEGSGAWHNYTTGWVPVVAVVAALSMILGNLAAIVQTSVRRLLAYSAVGHAGYMLLGILAHSAFGVRALIYYVITYALAAIGAFGVLAALESNRGEYAGIDEIADFRGFSRRAPVLSLCMLVFLLSLAGIPPLAGFFAKFYIFAAALAGGKGDLGMLWLVILAIAMSAVSLYYYLKVLKQIYVSDPPAGAPPIRTPWVVALTICVIALLVLLLGCMPNLLIHWIECAMRLLPA